jgi:hypothetical protein
MPTNGAKSAICGMLIGARTPEMAIQICIAVCACFPFVEGVFVCLKADLNAAAPPLLL